MTLWFKYGDWVGVQCVRRILNANVAGNAGIALVFLLAFGAFKELVDRV